MKTEQTPKRGYLTDDTGKPSNMRLMTTLSIAVAIGLSALIGLIVYQGQDTGSINFLFNLTLIWLVAAFAPKVVQKYIERMFKGEVPLPTPSASTQDTTEQ